MRLVELMKLQGFPLSGYSIPASVSVAQMGALLGNSMSVDVLVPLFANVLHAAGLVQKVTALAQVSE